MPIRFGPVRFFATLVLIAAAFGAFAQAPAALEVDIPAQPMASALRSLAERFQLQILFSPEAVAGMRSAGAKGRLTATEAVAKVTEGTPLGYTFNGKDTLVIKLVGTTGGALQSTSPSALAPGAGADTNLEPVEVTGSRMKRTETETALPINTYTKEDIARSGQGSLAGFLNTLNEVSLVTSESANFQQTAGQPTVQLRGLPIGSTLVLLNGRRIQGTGTTPAGATVNLDLIPVAAIERIEILPVGASAVYGGDALAGVVNIILKKGLEGIVVEARYGHASGFDDSAASIAVGTRGDRGSAMALFSYVKRSTLNGDERDITNNQDFRRFGGPDARVQYCNPGTVSSTTASNLPGLNASSAGIPVNPTGRLLAPGDFAATAGTPNLCSRNSDNILIFGATTSSALLTADYRFSDRANVFAELIYTDYRQDSARGGTLLSNVMVPAANAFNPFGVPVLVNGRTAPGSPRLEASLETTFVRPLVGLRGNLIAGWDYEVALSTGHDHGKNVETNQIANPVPFSAALASSDPATALNFFTSGPSASPAVLAPLYSDREYDAKGRRDVAVGFVRGPVYRLPAGTLDAVVGAEYNRDRYGYNSPQTAQTGDLGRTVRALFGELRAPLLSGTDGEPRPFERVTLTAAARRDDYSDFGVANTTQLGLEVRPIRSLLLRAAHSQAFKPPLLSDLVAQPFVFPTEAFGLVDPRHGNQPIVGGTIVFSASPDLRPEKGTATAFGAIWEPAFAQGLRASLNVWRINQKDHVIFLNSPQTILDNEDLLPGLVSRDASGNVTSVAWKFINFGKYLVEGIDYELSYVFRTSIGQWTTGASATQTTKFDTSLVPGSPVIDRLGHPDQEAWAPKWKSRFGVGWQQGPWAAGATGRYVGSYYDYDSSTRTIGKDWYFDFTASAQIGKLFGLSATGLRASTASIAIINAFNRLPRYANTPAGYDFNQADIKGRYVTVQVSVPWQ